jgi:GT2 family glycosyltransferase
MSQTNPAVSVVIPTWKRSDLLRRCLESLRRQTFTDFQTVVVSNGAGSSAEELAQEFGCALIRLEENRGFAAAVNAGIAAARSEYVLLLNDDVELERGWLGQMAALLSERGDLSFCCGKILRPDGRTVDDAGDALARGGSAWRLGFGRTDGAELDLPRPLLAISATAALFRRTALEALGGFDEDFVSYLEDMDWSLRALRAGLRGFYWPRAVARHHGGATLGGAESPQVFELLTRNQLLLLAKHYPAQYWFRLAPPILWAQALWALMAIRKGRVRPYCKGFLRFLGALPSALRKRGHWSGEQRQAFWSWLQKSEEAIYADVGSREVRDTFWRMYFALFSTKRRRTAAAKAPLGRLPSR